MTKKSYWAVAWGGEEGEPTIRIAHVSAAEEAMKYCYGILSQAMTAERMPGNPRYMSAKAKEEFFTKLREDHAKRLMS